MKQTGQKFLILILILSTEKVWSKYPEINGSSETIFYLKSFGEPTTFEDKDTTRGNELLYFNILFSDSFGIYTSNKITARITKNETPNQADFMLLYGYGEYRYKEKITGKAGRILEINIEGYNYFDGLAFNYHNIINGLDAGLFGGLIVNSDYITDENLERADPYEFSTHAADYRNFFSPARKGDYLAGQKVQYTLKKLFYVGLEHQLSTNENKLAEHSISLDYETSFSEIMRFFGYVTFDFVEKLPSTVQIMNQFHILKNLSFMPSYEYYRPVFMKNSFFWSMFQPYGTHEANFSFIYRMTEKIHINARYGRIMYESTGKDYANDFSAGYMDRELFRKLYFLANIDALLSSFGNKIRLRARFHRPFRFFGIEWGGGCVFYTQSADSEKYEKAMFLSAGISTEFIRNLTAYTDLEYYVNEKYEYDIRSIIGVKYIF